MNQFSSLRWFAISPNTTKYFKLRVGINILNGGPDTPTKDITSLLNISDTKVILVKHHISGTGFHKVRLVNLEALSLTNWFPSGPNSLLVWCKKCLHQRLEWDYCVLSWAENITPTFHITSNDFVFCYILWNAVLKYCCKVFYFQEISWPPYKTSAATF